MNTLQCFCLFRDLIKLWKSLHCNFPNHKVFFGKGGYNYCHFFKIILIIQHFWQTPWPDHLTKIHRKTKKNPKLLNLQKSHIHSFLFAGSRQKTWFYQAILILFPVYEYPRRKSSKTWFYQAILILFPVYEYPRRKSSKTWFTRQISFCSNPAEGNTPRQPLRGKQYPW